MFLSIKLISAIAFISVGLILFVRFVRFVFKLRSFFLFCFSPFACGSNVGILRAKNIYRKLNFCNFAQIHVLKLDFYQLLRKNKHLGLIYVILYNIYEIYFVPLHTF